MAILKNKFTATLVCACLLASNVLTTKAEAAVATNSIYQNAKTQLPPDFYALYRIVDRLARANEYDTRPWQVVRVAKYDTQAFAKNANLIAIYNGALEQLGGDASALGCMIAHEMAHHKQRHQVISKLEKAEIIAEIREEAIAQVLNRKRKTSPVAIIGDFVVRRVIGGTIGSVVNGVLDNRNSRRFRKHQRRINVIVDKKTAELEENIKKQKIKDEFEADEVAYLASVRAGFDKQGCLRAMSVLNRTSGVKFDENHPTIEERIAAIKAVMEKFESESLIEEGKENLFQTQPLTYNLSANQTSLRVNSRHGASIGDDIDKMFGS
ncbi:Zn-dependent protease with chaperone function [Rivularia sp. PCC 7116]|uniref:M48 family metalloprotease n=1 Tax=Rivularia sp. PCC 7116 TaxID=373994 RepID=UPI00029EEA32|nr:M48 family metalloprotease [Rivularia sp. PCC 7116]AFY57123.1 Zn-dependent protease with chaperone function [Rivularia sp. PCC 7116]